MSLVSLAHEAIKISNDRAYQIKDKQIKLPVQGQVKTYTEEELQNIQEIPFKDQKIQVIQSCTVEACLQNRGKKIAVLNFANAYGPGGSFLQGVKAQEEKICRCSDLYQCLLTQKQQFYDYHMKLNNALQTDRIIVSQNQIFRDQDYCLLEQPLEVTIVTAAAVNCMFVMQQDNPIGNIQATMEKRINNVLKLIGSLNVDLCILGAFGCGAFGNDAAEVAGIFHKLIVKQFVSKEVVFAIYGGGYNLECFEEEFENKGIK